MVKKLLAPKRTALTPDYELSFFERCLGDAFVIERSKNASSRAPGSSTTPARRADGDRGSGEDHAGLQLAEGGALALRQPGSALDVRSRSNRSSTCWATTPSSSRPGAPRGGTSSRSRSCRWCFPPLLLLSVRLLLRLGHTAFKGARLVLIGALVTLPIAAQALKKAIDSSDVVLIGLSASDRDRGGHALRARRPAALVPQRAHAGPARVPAPVPAGLAGLEARVPG